MPHVGQARTHRLPRISHDLDIAVDTTLYKPDTYKRAISVFIEKAPPFLNITRCEESMRTSLAASFAGGRPAEGNLPARECFQMKRTLTGLAVLFVVFGLDAHPVRGSAETGLRAGCYNRPSYNACLNCCTGGGHGAACEQACWTVYRRFRVPGNPPQPMV